MTLEEFKQKKNPQTIQEEIDVEWRYSQAKIICESLQTDTCFIVYSETEDKLYLHIPLE